MGSREVVGVGVGGQAKSVLEACRAGGVKVAGFLVPEDRNAAIPGAASFGTEERLRDRAFVAGFSLVAATDDRSVRRRIAAAVLAAQGSLATVVHPYCVVASTAEGACIGH